MTMSQANVVSTAANVIWYTDRIEIVTGSTPVTYQVYATALRDQSAQGNIYSDPSLINAYAREEVYVGVGNYLTVSGTGWAGTEIGGQTSAQAGVGGYGINSITPPPPPPGPAVTSVTPALGTTAGNTNIVISGTGFVSVTGVTMGGANVASFVAANSTAIAAVTAAASAGAANIVVTTSSGNSNGNIVFTYGAPPTVASIAPNLGYITGATAVSITGTNFVSATGVTIGGNAASNVMVVDTSTITATSPAGSIGTASVEVTTPYGTSGNNTLFNYLSTPVTTTGYVVSIFGDNGLFVLSGNTFPTMANVNSNWTINYANGTYTGYTVALVNTSFQPGNIIVYPNQTTPFVNGDTYTFTSPSIPAKPTTGWVPGVGSGPVGNTGGFGTQFQLSYGAYPCVDNVVAGWTAIGANGYSKLVLEVVNGPGSIFIRTTAPIPEIGSYYQFSAP